MLVDRGAGRARCTLGPLSRNRGPVSKSSVAAAGLLVVALIGAPVAYTLGWVEIAIVLLTLPGVVAAVIALDVRSRLRRRVRGAEEWQRAVVRRLEQLPTAEAQPRARADVATYDDLIGTVRVIQAQYTGRLDHAQHSLDEAVRALRAHIDATTPEEMRTSE